MSEKFTSDKLNIMSSEDKDQVILAMQERIDSLESNLEKLIEQIRIANAHRFGRSSEKLNVFDGQLSLFDEAEFYCDPSVSEPDIEDVLPAKPKKKKQKGKREDDFRDLPVESHDYARTKDELDAHYGTGNWRELPVETYKELRYEPAKWIVDRHDVHVYVGTTGDHQDEFLRGKHPRRLFRTSFATPSILAAVLNGKYTNAMPLKRIEDEFLRNDLALSRQTMSNWIINSYRYYFIPVLEKMKSELILRHICQSDETPVTVINDKSPDTGSMQGYMWVYRTGELSSGPPIIIYEYHKSRSHDVPAAFYKEFKGILVTDSLGQYHILERELPGITNANCWAHARRDFADAIKGLGKVSEDAVHQSIAYKALQRIALIYNYDGTFKKMSPNRRLRERKKHIAPLVDEFFAWVKSCLEDTTALPKGKTAQGLKFCINQEKYLRVFLTDGEVPLDNSASERSIRPFTVGRKNWMFINSVKGADASAAAYSIVETAKANGLNIYYYFEYLLSELKELTDDEGNIDQTKLDPLMPWSKTLPTKCYKEHR